MSRRRKRNADQVCTSSAQQIRGGFQNGIIRITPGAGPGSGTPLISHFETGLLAGSLDTRWELSFWNGTAKRYSAAKADVEMGLEDLADLRLIVSAETARAYFELRGFERQLAAARRNRVAQAELLALTQERARAGLAPGLDVERQRASLASLDAAMEPLEWQRRLRLHRLALLTGDRELAERGIDAAPLDEMRLPALGDGVDSALLERRPDVRAAQARIQAAMARRRSAKADLLPRVLLTGLAGRQGTSVAGLSLGARTFFGVGPQLVLPVFTGGGGSERKFTPRMRGWSRRGSNLNAKFWPPFWKPRTRWRATARNGRGWISCSRHGSPPPLRWIWPPNFTELAWETTWPCSKRSASSWIRVWRRRKPRALLPRSPL